MQALRINKSMEKNRQDRNRMTLIWSFVFQQSAKVM